MCYACAILHTFLPAHSLERSVSVHTCKLHSHACTHSSHKCIAPRFKVSCGSCSPELPPRSNTLKVSISLSAMTVHPNRLPSLDVPAGSIRPQLRACTCATEHASSRHWHACIVSWLHFSDCQGYRFLPERLHCITKWPPKKAHRRCP